MGYSIEVFIKFTLQTALSQLLMRSLIMHYNLILYGIFISMINSSAASKLIQAINFFIEDVVESLQWKHVILVHCSDADLVFWNRKSSASAYVQLLSEINAPVILQHEGILTPVVLLPSCSLASRIVIQANHTGLFRRKFSWWFLVSGTNFKTDVSDEIYKRFSGLQVDINSDVNIVSFGTALSEKGLEVLALVWDIYKLKLESPLCLKLVGRWNYFSPNVRRWNSQVHFSSHEHKLLFRSYNLDGIILRIGVLVGKPDYEFDCKVEQDLQGQITTVQGFSSYILKVLMDHLHFRVEFVGSDTWGSQDDEGVWVGLLGLLAEDEVDLVLCHPTVTVERTASAQFLHSTLHSRRMLIYRAEGLPLTQDVFVLTFTGSVWLVCLAIALILLAACFHFASLQTSKYLEGRPKPWTWVEITLWAVAATCQQGFSKEPEGLSCKAVFLIGYLASYLLYTWFAAGVTSLLAVQGKDTHLQLEDVVRMGIDFCAAWDGLLPDYFLNSPDPAAQVLLTNQLRKERNKVYSLELMFQQLHGDNKVAMASEHPLKHYMITSLSMDDACQLTLSTAFGTKHLKAWAVQKGSPYRDIFNYWLIRLRETGILQLGLQKSMVTLTSCGSGPGYSSAGIGHVMSALGILGSGIAASIFLLIIELAWHYHRATHRRH